MECSGIRNARAIATSVNNNWCNNIESTTEIITYYYLYSLDTDSGSTELRTGLFRVQRFVIDFEFNNTRLWAPHTQRMIIYLFLKLISGVHTPAIIAQSSSWTRQKTNLRRWVFLVMVLMSVNAITKGTWFANGGLMSHDNGYRRWRTKVTAACHFDKYNCVVHRAVSNNNNHINNNNNN